ncbi:MAG TPA: fibronectin type III domain-containing protein, partial [Verrucomicrobiae bacterium]
RAYQVRYSVSGGAWLPIVDSTQARQIAVENLTPGTTYVMQARAVGGSRGYSDWSDPVSHMAM